MPLVFSCVHCTEEFSVEDEYLGEEVACPACDGGNVLPTTDEFYGTATVVGMEPIEDEPEPATPPSGNRHGVTAAGLPDFFTDAEWSQLAASDRNVYNAVYDWSNREAWQFAFIAAMLRARLTTLRARVAEPLTYTRTISLFRSRAKINDTLSKHADRFLYMNSNLNQQLNHYLWYVLFQSQLAPTYDLFQRIDPWISKLGDFHDALDDLPQLTDEAGAEMQHCMSRWVPWVWQSLDQLAATLERESQRRQSYDARCRPQISVQPPSLHAFFIAQAELVD